MDEHGFCGPMRAADEETGSHRRRSRAKSPRPTCRRSDSRRRRAHATHASLPRAIVRRPRDPAMCDGPGPIARAPSRSQPLRIRCSPTACPDACTAGDTKAHALAGGMRVRRGRAPRQMPRQMQMPTRPSLASSVSCHASPGQHRTMAKPGSPLNRRVAARCTATGDGGWLEGRLTLRGPSLDPRPHGKVLDRGLADSELLAARRGRLLHGESSSMAASRRIPCAAPLPTQGSFPLHPGRGPSDSDGLRRGSPRGAHVRPRARPISSDRASERRWATDGSTPC